MLQYLLLLIAHSLEFGFSYLRCSAVILYLEITVILLDSKIPATASEFVLLPLLLIERPILAQSKHLQLATAVFFLLPGRRPEFAKVCSMAASKVSSSHESS